MTIALSNFDFMVIIQEGWYILGEDEDFKSFGVTNPLDIFRGEKDGHEAAGEAMFVPLLIITTY